MSTPISERATIEILAVGLAALTELQRRMATERLSTRYQRDSIASALHFFRRWHDGEVSRG